MAMRIQELKFFLEPAISEAEKKYDAEFNRFYDENVKALSARLLKSLSECNEKSLALQGTGKKSGTELIAFSFLLSGFATKKYDLRVDFCDKRMFLDTAYAYSYFSYDFLGKTYEGLSEIIKINLKGKFTRVMGYEIDELARSYHVLLYEKTKDLITRLISDEGFLSEFMSFELAGLQEISYGYYLNDQNVIIHVLEG